MLGEHFALALMHFVYSFLIQKYLELNKLLVLKLKWIINAMYDIFWIWILSIFYYLLLKLVEDDVHEKNLEGIKISGFWRRYLKII